MLFFRSAKLQFVTDFFQLGETFRGKIEFLYIMKTASKIALGISVASGALLAAWLLTGDRKQKTKDFIVKKTNGVKNPLNQVRNPFDDSEAYYI